MTSFVKLQMIFPEVLKKISSLKSMNTRLDNNTVICLFVLNCHKLIDFSLVKVIKFNN